MSLFVVFAIGTPVLAVLIVLNGLYNEHRALRLWETVLDPAVSDRLDSIEAEVRLTRAMANDAWRWALDARSSRRFDEAIRLVDLACWALETATPVRLRRLKGLAIFSRMAGCLVPAPPLSWNLFRLREVQASVGLAALLHSLLVTTEERFRLRLRVLSFGFWIAVRRARYSVSLAKDTNDLAFAMATFELASRDWLTCDIEHVEAFRMVIVSLAAAEKAA